MTVRELHERTHTPKETLRRQLASMEAKGLVFRVGKQWWRYHFDADWLAERLGIPRTDLLRQRQFERDREEFAQSRAALPDGHPKRLVPERLDGRVAYVHPTTGEIRWMTADSEEASEE